MAAGTISLVAVLRDARIEIGCCRFRHSRLPKSGKPDFGARSSGRGWWMMSIWFVPWKRCA